MSEIARSYVVFEYGCLPPAQGAAAALDQMSRRHRLWNTLVEIERAHNSEVLKVLSDRDVEEKVALARARLSVLHAEIRGRRQAARSREVDVSDLEGEILLSKKLQNEAIADAKSRRRQLIGERKAELDSLEGKRRAAVKLARAESGLYWCNYDEILTSYEQGRKQTCREGGELRFRRWDGSGKLTVRFQYGLPVSAAYGSDTRLQIDPVDSEAWTSRERSVRRKRSRSNVRMRIGSNKRAPIWLQLPVVLHRPLPDEGLIRSASVFREVVGFRSRWRFVITVEGSAPVVRAGPSVGVDLGWRKFERGLRVAYWENENGEHGELILDDGVLSQFAKLEELRSIQQRQLEEARSAVEELLRPATTPGWMTVLETAHLHSPRRLLQLHEHWSKTRFDEDGEAFRRLTEWRSRYVHQRSWESNLRDQLLRHRRENYRLFVASLLNSHGTVFLEAFNIRSVSEKSPHRDGARSFSGRLRAIASPSVLRAILEKKGGSVRVDARHSTQTCSWCGHLEHWDAAQHVFHRCEKCGITFDQDRNAARNILFRGQAIILSVSQGQTSRMPRPVR